VPDSSAVEPSLYGAVGLVLGAAAIAALLAGLDTALKVREPTLAFKTKEWWGLWAVNCIVAFVILYAAEDSGRLTLSSFLGFLTAIFSYPLLLHTKLFTLRGEDPKDEKSFGPQFFLEAAEKLLSPGMEESIQEMGAKLYAEWRAKDIGKIGAAARAYVTSHALPNNHPRSRDDVLTWVDRLVADSQANPVNSDKNCGALFVEIQSIGNLRGVRWVLRQSKA
jgi:hypothetical protein